MHKLVIFRLFTAFIFLNVFSNAIGQLVPNEPLIAYNNTPRTICQGVPVKIQMQAGSCPGQDVYSLSIDGGSTYQTIVSAGNPSYVTAWNVTDPNLPIVTINTTTATGSIWVRMASCSPSCSKDQKAYDITPAPVVNPGAGTICSGSSYSYTPTSTPSGATYTWSAPSVAGISGTTAGTDLSSFGSGTLISTNGSATVVTYSVTPKVGTCLGIPFNVSVAVTPSTTNSTPITACGTYTWPVNGQTYTTGGTYTSVNGPCDVDTLHLTITPATGTATTQTVCGSYVWNGTTYTTSGDYTHVNGPCDVDTLHLTITPATGTATTQTQCGGDFAWNGTTYNTSGTYTFNSGGCNVDTLHLTITPVSTSTTNTTVCQAQLPYLWNGYSFVAAGTHTISLTNSAGCDSLATLNLTVNPTSTSTSSLTICSAQLPYLWNGYSFVAAGTHTVTLTNTAGCDSLATMNLTVTPTTSNTTTISACNTYTWSVNGITYNTSGTYTVTNGCDTEILVLTINQSPAINNTVTTDVTCNGLSDGDITFVTSSPVTVSPAPTNLSAGTYTFIITDQINGCSTTSSSITINEPTVLVPSASNSVITTPGGTSTLVVGATGGTAPYTGTGTFTVVAGTYTYTVTDARGCFANITFTITQPAPLTASAAASTPIPCHNGNGNVTVTPTGGTSPYTFTNGTVTNTTGVFTESAGAHTYTVTDFYNNTTTTTITLINPPILTANSVATIGVLACNGNQTTVTVTGTGGTPFPNGSYNGAGTFTVGAGIHPYTIEDANGCQATTQVTITEPTAITSSTQVQNILCQDSTGSINLTVSGGTPGSVGTGYTYVWSPGGATTEDLAAVAAGTYTVTISDNNGCTSTQTATVSNTFSTIPVGINNLTVGTPTQLTCTTTSISLQGFGGSNYVWSGSANSIGAPLTVTTPGTYNLALNDSNGCPKTASIIITQDITQPVASITNNSNTTIITCSTPTINVTAVGPNPVWSSPLTGGANQSISSPGTYTVTTTGTNGCTNTASITITHDITPPVAAITNNTGATTLNCNTTSISLTATGGASPTGTTTSPYAWSNTLGTSFGTNANVSITAGGTYTVTVTGANGCTDTETITINQVANPTLTAPSVSVCSGNSVIISALPSDDGLGTYCWTGVSNPGCGVTVDSFSVSLLSSTSYSVVYTATNGCSSPSYIILATVLQSPILTVTGTTTLCSGTNGVITATPSPNLPGAYHWSDGTFTLTPTTPVITVTPLVTTTYEVYYQSPNGCYADTVYHTINVTPTPVVSVPSTGVCVGGTATLTATPNIPLPPLPGGTYVWSAPGGTTNSITVTPAATTTYTVTYTLNSCPGIGTATVTVTEQPTVTIADIGICLGETGTVTAVPSSIAGNGLYTWTPTWPPTSPVIGGATFNVSPPQTSQISVVYTLNNCASLPDTAWITVTNAPTITFANTVVCSGDSAALTAIPSTVGGDYDWSTGDTTQVTYVSPTVNTVYTVTYDLNGCLVEDSTTVSVNVKPTVTFDVDIIEGCSPLKVKFTNTTSQTANCTWDLGNGTQINQCGSLSYTFLQAGCYDISLTTDSPNGCSNTTTMNDLVCVFPQPTASFNLSSEVVSVDNPTFNVNNNSEGAVEYVWDFGNGITDTNFEPSEITYSGNLQTEYQITLTAISEHGCVDSTFRTIKVSDELTVYVPNTFIPDGDGQNDVWYPVVNGGMYENTYELIVVNRWGEIVFKTNDFTQGWDGTYKGSEAQDGTYTYSIRFRSTFDKQNKLITGHVNLLR